jgi:heme-degrading monooxygenase HmoA
MYARVTRVQATPDAIEKLIANFKEKVLPTARSAAGFGGGTLLVNRETGEAAGVTYWESAKALVASEDVGTAVRTQAAEATAARITNVQRLELVHVERLAAPRTPSYVRIVEGSTEPEKLDEMISFMKGKALAEIKAQKGLLTVIAAVDRTTGATVVSTAWESAEARATSEANLQAVRDQAGQMAGTKPKVSHFESAVVEIAQPAVAGA